MTSVNSPARKRMLYIAPAPISSWGAALRRSRHCCAPASTSHWAPTVPPATTVSTCSRKCAWPRCSRKRRAVTRRSCPRTKPCRWRPSTARWRWASTIWWDESGEFKPLHEINPLRLDYIERLAAGFAGKRVVDVGCGGGILSESMAQRGAQVLGIDLSDKALGVAQLHQLESGAQLEYRLVSAEQLAT